MEEAPYEKVPLSVPDKFVEPDAAALRKIAADKIVKDKAFANSASKPQWTGDFLPPLHLAPQSDSFGNQRIFNENSPAFIADWITGQNRVRLWQRSTPAAWCWRGHSIMKAAVSSSITDWA